MRFVNKVIRILCLLSMIVGFLLALVGFFPDIQTQTEFGIRLSHDLSHHFVGAALFPKPEDNDWRLLSDGAILIVGALIVWQLANRRQRRDLSAIATHWTDLKQGIPLEVVREMRFTALSNPSPIKRYDASGDEIQIFSNRLYSMQFRNRKGERNWELDSWQLREFSDQAHRRVALNTLRILLLGD